MEEVIDLEPNPERATLFSGNRSTDNGMTLSYFPPQLVNGQAVVQLEKEEVDPEIEKWKCSLIVYVIRDSPGYSLMYRYIKQTWNKIADPNCSYMTKATM